MSVRRTRSKGSAPSSASASISSPMRPTGRTRADRWVGSGDLQGAVGVEIEGPPGDFPEVAVGIGEVAAVAAPEGVGGRLRDLRACRLRGRENLIHLVASSDVVSDRDARELRSRDVEVLRDVLRELLVGIELEAGSLGLEEDDAVLGLARRRQAQPVP